MSTEYPLRKIYSDSGLVSNVVNDIYQDKEGFIWLSSYEGVSRFDGKRYKNYQTDKNISHGLPDNWVEMVRDDQYGNHWFATKFGLALLPNGQEEFEVYRHYSDNKTSLSNDWVLSVLADSRGTLWVGTNLGLNIFDYQKRSFKRVNPVGNKLHILAEDFTQVIVEDAMGTVWFGTGSGG